MEEGELTVQVLGPVRLLGAPGVVIDLPSASQRRLLGALAIHAGTPVRAEWLCELLDISAGGLRTLVSRLRRALGDRLHTTIGGYRLDAPVDSVLACDEIRSAAGDPVALARVLDRWVGPALEEFADEPWAVGEAVRLATIRAATVEDLAESLINRRRSDDALTVLEPHVVEHPYRDRPRGLAMRALAAAGRQTESLRAFQHYRDVLGETAGTEPSGELRAIEQRIATGWDGVDDELGDSLEAAPAASRPTLPLPDVLAGAPVGVGRDAELAVLTETARQARTSGARSVLVSGEAGIGKTTLLATFARDVCPSLGCDVFYGRSDEHVAVPFQPFPAVVSRLIDTLPDDVLMAHTALCGGDLLRLAPQLQRRIATPIPPAGEVSVARHQLFEATLDVVRRAAAIAPLVLILDDLHWAEPAALHLLTHLVRNLGDAPVVFVVGFRDTGEGADDHLRTAVADLTRSDAARIELHGLDTGELGDLVTARAAATAGHDVGPVADRLLAETGGNPLFAEHLLRYWIGAGQLEVDDLVARPPTATALEVPSALRDLVWHRVAVLGADAQPVLTAAAVFGVQFNERVLSSMAGMAQHDVRHQLDRAVSAGVLADHPSISGTVRFAHALVARSLEAELGSRAAMSLHADAFEALSTSRATPDAELAPQLARHAELGGLLEEAQRWAAESGDLALADLAPDEAARWFRKALDHATTLDRPDAERADLLVRLGEAESRAGVPIAFDTIRHGAELAVACGADATLVRAALATDRGSVRLGAFAPEQLAIVEAALARTDHTDLVTRARLTALLAQSLGHTDQADRLHAAALEALDLARSSLDPTLLARVAPNVLYALWSPGTGAIRAALAAEATALVNEMNDPHLAFRVHYVAYSSAVCAGDAARARTYLDRAHAIAEQIGEPTMRWIVGILDGYTATVTGRLAEAEVTLAATLDLGLQIGESDAFSVFAAQTFVLGTFAGRHADLLPIIQQAIDAEPYIELPFRVAHALVCCEVGRPEVAASLLHDAMAGLNPVSSDWLGSTTLLGYAILTIELEDVAAAGWLYPLVAPMAGEVSFNGLTSQGPISAYAGKLASLLGRYEDAEHHLLGALATADAFGWEYHRATTFIALTQNRVRARGFVDGEAERWLATAEDLCETFGFDSWAKRAARLRAVVSA